jgi:hypothetical protein
MHRREVEGSLADDAPPSLPENCELDEVQTPDDGVGPLFHRRYRIRIRETPLTPEELVARVARDPDAVAPSEFATFQKVHGADGVAQPGDEYVVRMAGPWDGPVRMVESLPTSFRLATLEGHLEAGQIRFSAGREDGMLVFTIESWARSGDRLSDVLYDRLHMAKEIQLHMWTSCLERVAKLAGGRITGGVEIVTRKVLV